MLSAYLQWDNPNDPYLTTAASSFIKLQYGIDGKDYASSYYDHRLRRSVRLIRPGEKFMVLERLQTLAVPVRSIISAPRSKQVFPFSVLFGETTGVIYFEFPSINGNFGLLEVAGRKPL